MKLINLKKFYSIFVFLIIFLVYSIKPFYNNTNNVEISYLKHSLMNVALIKNCSKWIVLTTINEPSDSVKYLRDSTFDWCFVSISDIKTIQNWKYKDIQFIDTNQQYELKDKFKIINKIPFNSYFRKIVGYLKAIEQKANYIYEINDLNSAQDGLLGFKYETFNGIKSSCNDYEPLVIDSLFKKCNIYSITNKYPIIQYSLQNKEMDSNQPPLSLKEKQYVAYGSDNTFYHYDSFWSLLFPSMFKSNESIVIRAILAKRLLDEINSTISFMAPNNFNNNCTKKYSNQFKMFINKLILNLNEWKCTNELFYECFIDIIYYLVKKNIFNSKEIDFYIQWIEDLNNLNYKWPELKKIHLNKNLNNNLVYFNQNVRNSKAKQFKNVCNASLNLNLIETNEQVILITQAEDITDLEYISIIQTHFYYIIVCLNTANNNIDLSIYSFTFILTNEPFSQCIETAFRIGFKKESFLIAKQFLEFKYWNFKYATIEKSANLNSIGHDIYYVRRNVALGKPIYSLD
jgi:hypothetical protein